MSRLNRNDCPDSSEYAVNSSSSVEAGQEVASSLPDAIYSQANIADEEQAKSLVEAAIDKWGRLDVLINNAGATRVIPHDDLDAVTAEDWDRILKVNIVGTWFVTRAAAPALKESGGSVVNISSVAGVRPGGSCIPYAVSKAGLNHMTRLLAKVLGPEVRVNAVAPGLIDTPWTADWDAVRAAVRERTPLGRSGTPEDIARATLLLTLSPYSTGDVVVVDGGMHLVG